MKLETPLDPDQVRALADRSHAPEDLAAPLSSGSFHTDGMVVAPCSMKSLSMIAFSLNDNLLVRVGCNAQEQEARPCSARLLFI
jgi:4-hydroxy-3-polyprenylbenzoate decarboxylase